MSQSQSQQMSVLTASQKQYSPPLPFYQLGYNSLQQLTIQQFIKGWIEQIFFCNRKIETEARVQIVRSIAKFKLFQLSSCSSVYQLIRFKIEQISQLLRRFIEMSYRNLDKQKLHLCKILETIKANFDNNSNTTLQLDQPFLGTVHPPVAKMFVLFYKYVCGSIKQVCNLWKTIYHSIPVKDLQVSTFQKSISTFVLQIFISSNKVFSPLGVLPSMSLVNKCKFICADSQGVARRLELCRFDQEEMKKVLIEKKTKRKQPFGINPQCLNDYQRQILQEIKGHFSEQKKMTRGYQKLKIDIPFIEELKNQVISNEIEEERLEIVKPILQQKNLYNDNLLENIKGKYELSSTFQPHSGLIYEIDDASSEEQPGVFYECITQSYIDQDGDKDELKLDSQEILLQYLQAKAQHKTKEIDGSTKLSASTANEEQNKLSQAESFDFTAYPDFYVPEVTAQAYLKEYLRQQCLVSNKTQTIEVKAEKIEVPIVVQKLTQTVIEDIPPLKASILCLKKHEKILHKQNSKKYLQQEKQKLQKYRKELQKEKAQLLKEVQRFMKEKEKDQFYIKQANSRINNRNTHRNLKAACECTQSLKKFSFTSTKNSVSPQEFHFHCSQTDNYKHHQEKSEVQTMKPSSAEEAITNEIYKNMCKQEESQSGEKSNTEQNTTSNKKRQKNKKKAQKQLKTPTSQGKVTANLQHSFSTTNEKEEELASEEQVQLVKIMENLKIKDNTRVNCCIQESKLQKWKDRLFKIRNSQITFKKTSKYLQKDQKKQEKPKKKLKK